MAETNTQANTNRIVFKLILISNTKVSQSKTVFDINHFSHINNNKLLVELIHRYGLGSTDINRTQVQ